MFIKNFVWCLHIPVSTPSDRGELVMFTEEANGRPGGRGNVTFEELEIETLFFEDNKISCI